MIELNLELELERLSRSAFFEIHSPSRACAHANRPEINEEEYLGGLEKVRMGRRQDDP